MDQSKRIEVSDERVIDAGYDEIRHWLSRELPKVYGAVEEDSDGRWLVRFRDGSVSHTVIVMAEPQGSATRVSVAGESRRRLAPRFALAAAFFVATAAMFVASGLLPIFDTFDSAFSSHELPTWLGAPAVMAALGLCALIATLLKRQQLNAMGVITRTDALWQRLDELESAPRVAGYRIAPQSALERDADALAEADAIAAEESEPPRAQLRASGQRRVS